MHATKAFRVLSLDNQGVKRLSYSRSGIMRVEYRDH